MGAKRKVKIGPLYMGGGEPVLVQSMTNTDTHDLEATLAQIRALAKAGCDLVRVAIHDEACVDVVRPLSEGSPVPLVADIHFDAGLAVAAVERGIQKLRINPGNIGGMAKVRRVADCAKAHGVPIRIGVNGGSLERDLLKKYGGPTPAALLESALTHVKILEDCAFDAMVLSLKANNVRDTVEAYRLAAKCVDYPLHLGVTEAGLPERGTIQSAVAIGALLLDDVGDTVRVSLSGDPLLEVPVAIGILRAVGLRQDAVEVIACPTCGRTGIDVAGIAARVQEAVRDVPMHLKVAVMGCVVNGPGEAREADIGIAGGADGGVLFVKDQPPRKVKGDLAEALIAEIRAMARALAE